MNALTAAQAWDVVRPFYAAFESGDVGLLDSAFAPDWRDNTLPAGRPAGLAGMKLAIQLLRGAVPDLRAAVEDRVFEGDRLSVRITFTGTHTGPFLGFPPTGHPVRFIAFDLHRLAGGRVAESWHLEDNLTVLGQFGMVRMATPPGSAP